jgi:hypothetical protein
VKPAVLQDHQLGKCHFPSLEDELLRSTSTNYLGVDEELPESTLLLLCAIHFSIFARVKTDKKTQEFL